MKPRVPNEILQKYYELWLSGCSVQDIRESLNITVSKFNQYTPDFLNYCRHQVKFDIRARLTNGELPNLVTLTTEREEQFIQLLSTGLSYDKVALLMNIPLVTVLDYWFKNPEFKAKVRIATELTNARVTQALFKRAIGYQYDGGYKTRTKGVKVVEYKNKDTGEKLYKEIPYHSETIIEKINVVEPDVNAAKFWLFNRNPEQFSIDGQRTDINNKGKILAWIEENTKMTNNELEDYDWEQDEYDEKYLEDKSEEM
jgi:DNA-binding CsgD family transcriptional regulator